ncbi:mechanosensitive ion channel family protein [Alteromonas macleodii]|uniref:Small-conductance mechanosensitive channel n=1 Tax=Alteromonas macleodii TaxID=28108 RepID=A0AB36G1V1_ALTMA|nr:mechanosensitive ion channel family protein [Alteromonas macleodii]OES33819.1 mechanosensitive ion channel family protein [Alteromonas macleodii]OES35682.1 mechanosensitive ion channel family protein [Alteromonas macleodii]OES36861.1 mechanosensitive ion channel family protein [Alteromonas macleodii]OES42565.1 mechanosensitive ion channel family protein [Alteromonas macleodii]OZB93844.1 mechanosensitive ion channel protein [Alteromonas macleodii]|tara:strand:+ start:1311 stop:2297 length:987 start_codon:yes stop_codon:yes gene_type:complete
MEFPKIDEVYKLLSEKLESWVEGGITLLPNIVVAFFIAIAFGIIAKVIGNVAGKIMRRTFESRQIASLLTSIIKSVVLIAGIFIALDFVGLKGTVTSLLAGAGIVGLAIGFAFQDMTENFIAGVAMGIRKPFEIGDVIEAEGVFGNVKEINLRNTLVETFYGQLEVIPNKILFRNILTNYSYLGNRRIEVPVGISYADDIEEAAKVITDAMNEKDYVIKKEETAVYAESFGDSSINLLLWFWIRYPGEPGFMVVRHDAISTVKTVLEENDILIPFPIRTLDFNAKGGDKLNSMLKKQDERSSSKGNTNSSTEQSDVKAGDNPEQPAEE